jgi:hypothetical protein
MDGTESKETLTASPQERGASETNAQKKPPLDSQTAALMRGGQFHK